MEAMAEPYKGRALCPSDGRITGASESNWPEPCPKCIVNTPSVKGVTICIPGR